MNRKLSLFTIFLLVIFVTAAMFMNTNMVTAQENQPLAPVGTDFTYQGKLFGFQKVTDPELVGLNIDNVLLGCSIEDAISLNLQTYDFMQGGEAYKDRWTNDLKSNWILSAGQRTFRGRTHQGLNVLRSAIRHERL